MIFSNKSDKIEEMEDEIELNQQGGFTAKFVAVSAVCPEILLDMGLIKDENSKLLENLHYIAAFAREEYRIVKIYRNDPGHGIYGPHGNADEYIWDKNGYYKVTDKSKIPNHFMDNLPEIDLSKAIATFINGRAIYSLQEIDTKTAEPLVELLSGKIKNLGKWEDRNAKS